MPFFWNAGSGSHKSVSNISTQDLEGRAFSAFHSKKWSLAESLLREVIIKADIQGKQVARNLLGQVFEKNGRVDEAIALYEENVRERTDTPFPYLRLAILYRKRGLLNEEIQVLQMGMSAASENSSDIKKRLAKIGARFTE